MTERGWNHYKAVLTSTVGSEVSGPTSGYKDECVILLVARPNQTGLCLSPQRDRAVSGSVAGTTVYNSVPRTRGCLLKTFFFSHGLHWVFSISCVPPKAPTKSFFVHEQLNYCWIPERISVEDFLFFYLSDATQHTRF